MSQLGHSRPGRANSKPGQVRYAAESGNKFSISGAVLRVYWAAAITIAAAPMIICSRGFPRATLPPR